MEHNTIVYSKRNWNVNKLSQISNLLWQYVENNSYKIDQRKFPFFKYFSFLSYFYQFYMEPVITTEKKPRIYSDDMKAIHMSIGIALIFFGIIFVVLLI